jgi:hypothetical protein
VKKLSNVRYGEFRAGTAASKISLQPQHIIL